MRTHTDRKQALIHGGLFFDDDNSTRDVGRSIGRLSWLCNTHVCSCRQQEGMHTFFPGKWLVRD